MKETVNLIYHQDKALNGNFGDELSKFITEQLINTEKYTLVYNKQNIPLNIVCIGSYIHMAPHNSYIYGSGVRTLNNIENGHKYTNLNVAAVRGPHTRQFLLNRKINVPLTYGDPALLLRKLYTPNKILELNDKVGIIPHKSNYKYYVNKIDMTKYELIDPTEKWNNVIDCICSCKSIVSSSLHGLICADAFDVPNLWLDEYKLQEGDFKFKDYFASQNRNYVKITHLNQYDEALLYGEGNQINLTTLESSFPFV